jgi:hypothetical protein
MGKRTSTLNKKRRKRETDINLAHYLCITHFTHSLVSLSSAHLPLFPTSSSSEAKVVGSGTEESQSQKLFKSSDGP